MKIKFVWSWIYEQAYHSLGVKSEKFDYEKYSEFIEKFVSQLRPLWEDREEDILKTISENIGLMWKENAIKCYVVKRSYMFPISDPLTIPIEFEGEEIFRLSQGRYISMLTHELIHNILIQNEEKTNRYFKEIFQRYPDEKFDTIIHLIIHAIHKKVLLNVFSEEELKKEIESNQFYPDYKRSWEIVQEKGEEFIIKEFKSFF